MVLSSDRGEAADLQCDRRADVLRAVGDEFFDTGQDLGQHDRLVDQGAKARYLTRRRRPHFCLGIFQGANKRIRERVLDQIWAGRFRQLKWISDIQLFHRKGLHF